MKEMVLRAYQERCSLRGVERIFHVSRHTVPREAIQPYPSIEDTLLPADETDVLELDELVCADQKRWLWLALCRRTRQIVDFIIGDPSAKSCVRLWRQIPAVTTTQVLSYACAFSLLNARTVGRIIIEQVPRRTV